MIYMQHLYIIKLILMIFLYYIECTLFLSRCTREMHRTQARCFCKLYYQFPTFFKLQFYKIYFTLYYITLHQKTTMGIATQTNTLHFKTNTYRIFSKQIVVSNQQLGIISMAQVFTQICRCELLIFVVVVVQYFLDLRLL